MSKLTYTKCGDYYIPDLVYSAPDTPIGKYGLLRESYLKEHRSVRYNHMLMAGKLYPHLIDVDEQAQQLLDDMIPKLMSQQGITEQLKANEQLEWVGRMNNIKAQVEEVIFFKIVYR